MGDAFVKFTKSNFLICALHRFSPSFSPFSSGTGGCIMKGVASGPKAATFAVRNSTVFADVAGSIQASFTHVTLLVL